MSNWQLEAVDVEVAVVLRCRDPRGPAKDGKGLEGAAQVLALRDALRSQGHRLRAAGRSNGKHRGTSENRRADPALSRLLQGHGGSSMAARSYPNGRSRSAPPICTELQGIAIASDRLPTCAILGSSSGAGRAARRPAMPVICVISAQSRHKYVKFPARVAATAHSQLSPLADVIWARRDFRFQRQSGRDRQRLYVGSAHIG